jgi:hypothetical protein
MSQGVVKSKYDELLQKVSKALEEAKTKNRLKKAGGM